MKKSTKKIALGTIFAAIGGYLAGILTAPKSGKETRKDIQKTADKSIAFAEKSLKQLHTELNKNITKATKKLSQLTGKPKKELEAALELGVKAKNKARDLLSAVHEGDADDQDLKKAIENTTEAISHLKSFLDK